MITKTEKQMILAAVILAALFTLSMYHLCKHVEPVAKNIEQNGIKPYVMQIWEGKK